MIALGSGNPRNGESGSVLVMVIIVIMVMLTVGITTLMVSATDSKIIVPSSKQQAGVSVVRVTHVTVSPTVLSLITGPSPTSATVTATVYPENATNKGVTWSSANPLVATVDQNGLVTAVAAGTVVITVTTLDGGHSNTCAVTVSQPGQPYVIAPNGEITFIVLHNYYVAPSGHVLVVPKGCDLGLNDKEDITWTADAGMIIEVDLSHLGNSSFTFNAGNKDADIIIVTNVTLSPHKAITINAGRDIIICNVEISAGDTVYLNAGRDIKACGVILTASRGTANIDLNAGRDIRAESAYFNCKNNLFFIAQGTIYVTGATLTSDEIRVTSLNNLFLINATLRASDKIVLSVGNYKTVYVDGARFYKRAVATTVSVSSSVTIDGRPAVGCITNGTTTVCPLP